MSNSAEHYSAHLGTIADSVRELARLAVEQGDHLQMLEMLSHLGGMATHALEVGRLVADHAEASQGATASLLEDPAETDLQNATIDEPTPDMEGGACSDAPEETGTSAHEGYDEPQQPVDKIEIVSDGPSEPGTDDLAEYVRELHLTPRDEILMRALLSRKGELVTPAELRELIDGTVSARSQAVALFIRKLRNSSYAGRLHIEGNTNARRYAWQPEDLEASRRTVVAPAPQVTPLAMPLQRRVHEAVPNEDVWKTSETSIVPAEVASGDDEQLRTERLESLGIELRGEGASRYVAVRGVHLPFTGQESEIFCYVASHDEGVDFADLVDHFRGTRQRSDLIMTISQAVSRIPRVLKDFDGLAWTDRKVITEKGKNEAHRILGVNIPSDVSGESDKEETDRFLEPASL